jgi:RNA polymerase I-specific transcription initiation factor RRN3
VKFASKLVEIFLSSNKHVATRMSAVAYLASFLARGKFLPVSFVASMLKRWKRFLQNVTSNIIILSD